MTTEAPTKFSQYDEELHILAHTPETGTFLDIGAWHPKQFSNTRALYEKGWRGVMIEPSPIPFDSLLREYGNDERITLICGAVGPERLLAKIHATADAVSTMSEGVHDTWKNAGGYYGSFYTPIITLRELFNQFGGAFEFVNIDAEGLSVDLLHAMLEIGLRPQCICCEHDGRLTEVIRASADNGYRIVHENGTNAILSW